MIKFDILNRFSGEIILTAEIDCAENAERSVKLGLAVKWAVENKANLEDANLTCANLYRANLTCANLEDANLTCANLEDANLEDANLTCANLEDANLTCAKLTCANLYRANLYGANLTCANLYRANLYGAKLTCANLTCANLEDANLNVAPFKADFIAEVLKLPNELEALKNTIIEGKINGSTYSINGCSCLAGTMAKQCGFTVYSGQNIPVNGFEFIADSSSPRERWFMMIKPGNTPENNFASKKALEWTEEAITIRDHIRKAA